MSAFPVLEVFDRYVVELEEMLGDLREIGETGELMVLEIRRTKQARDNVERLIAAADDASSAGCPCDTCEPLRRAVNECRGVA